MDMEAVSVFWWRDERVSIPPCDPGVYHVPTGVDEVQPVTAMKVQSSIASSSFIETKDTNNLLDCIIRVHGVLQLYSGVSIVWPRSVFLKI